MWQADSSNSDFSSLSGQIAATGTLLNNKINSLSGYANDTFLSGNGVTNYVPRWNGSKLLITGSIYDLGTGVGIGTTSPSAKLEVFSGNAIIRNDNPGGAASLYIRNWATNPATQLVFGNSTSDDSSTTLDLSANVFSITNYGDPGSYIKFGTRNLSTAEIRVTIDPSGRVGIGTEIPSTLLSIGGAGSTSVLSGLTFGADSQANLYRISSARIKTDGNFTIDGQGGGSTSLVLNRSSTSSENGMAFNTAGVTDWYFYVNDATSNLQIQRLGENDATPRVRFDGSNSNVLFNLGGGNVGVGTDSPNYKLDVIGSVRASGELISEGNNARLSLFRNNGINYFDWASGQSLYLSTQTSVGGAGRNTLMTVTSGGRVGIGSVNPTDYLDFGAAGRNIVFAYAAYGEILNSAASIIGNNVKASPTGNSQVRRFASTPDAGNFIKLIYNKGVTFHTNLTSALNTDISEDANERMRINLSGDVGIGTVNPNGRLHVVSPDSTYAFSVAGATKGVRFNLNSAGTYIQGVDNTLAGSYQSLILGGSDLYFQTNGLTNAVYIDSSGDVGINTTSPTSKLHVVETTATGTRIQLGTASTNALMNSGSTNDLLILNAPYGNNPASTSNIGAKWGIKFVGSNEANQIDTVGKTSAIYAVSEDALGYNRGTSLAFYTNQLIDQTYAERMRIYHNGNVGIGTTSPAALLSVGSSGSTSAASGLAFGNDTSANLYRSAASTIKTDGSLEVAVKIVSPTITSLSGNLATTGSTLDSKINSLSGYCNANFATILNLAATGSTLNARINSLSGYAGSTFLSGQGVANWTARWNGTKELITGSIYDIGTAVGIGTLTPSTKLAVEGGSISTVNATGTDVKLSFDVRSLVGGAVGFNNAAATNVYGVATGLAYFGVAQAYPIAFTTNGTERLRIAAGGNVGIGSTNPAYKLDVNGSAGFTNGITVNADASSTSYFVGANGTRPIIFQNNTASAYDFGFKFTDLNTFTLVGGNTLANPTTDLVSFTYDGKVGIGITVPLQKFQIDGTVGNPALAGTTQSGIFRISNTTDNAILDFGLRSGGNGAWIQSTDETSLAANYSLLLNPNGGNVGIGTTAPVQKLDIRGYVVSDVNSNAVEGGFFLGNNSHGIRREAGSNDVRLHTNGGDLIFGAAGSGSQQVTLKNGGNLGIGTTNPTAKLQIENSGTISSVATVRLVGSTGNNAGSQIEFYKAQTPEASIGLASAVTGGLSDDLILLSANPNSIVLSAGASGISVFKADGKVGIGTINPQTLLSLGGLGSTSAASGLTFGGDAQANLYRSAEDTIRTDGSLVVNGNFNTNTTTVTTLNINAGTLPGIPAGSTITGFTYAVNNGNVSQINLVETRFATGSDWTTATTRIQKRVDVTNQAYIEFNPSGASYGMALGVGVNSNVEALRILSNGSIGIGTTNPATKLHVYGAGGGFEFGVGSSNCYIEAIDRANTSAFINTSYYTRGTGYFAWYNGSYTERMRIASNGNVGINSTTPTAKLSINKGGKDQFLALDIANNDAKYAFYVDQDNNGSNSFSIWDATNSHTAIRYLPSSGGYWQIYTNNVERIRINSDGYVGIDTTNPAGKLQVVQGDANARYSTFSSVLGLLVKGNDNSAYNLLTLENTQTGTNYGASINFNLGYGGNANTAGTAVLGARIVAAAEQNFTSTTSTQDGYLALYTTLDGTSSEKVRVRSDGSVGIGVTNPIEKLMIAGNIQLSGSNTSLNFNTDNAGNGNISFDGSTFTFVSNSNSAPIIFSTTSTERARITNAGRLGIGTSSPVSLLSVGGPGSTTAASGLTFGAEAASNIYRSSTNELKTDGSFVVSNTLLVGGGGIGLRILKDGSDSISSTLYLANAANTRAYNFQQNAAGTNLALWTYNSANTWQNSVNFNYNGSVGIGTTTPSGKLHIVSTIAGETVLRADGTNGTLFSVVDDLSDSLMSVNNSAGLPVLEVFADDRVVAGQYGSGDFVLVNNKVGIGTSNPSYKLDVNGSLGINASTSDTNWPFVVSDNSSAGSRYGLNKAGSMGFNYADAYAQLQLLGANGAFIDFTNSVGGDSNARLIYYAGARLDLTYGFITNGTISLNSNGIGIGTTSPVVALDVVGPIGSFPIAAGTTTTGVNLRLRNSNSNLVLDVGGNGGNGNWLQSTSRVDLSLSYPLLFNPNGGNVGIGTIAPTGVLTIHSNGTQLRLQTASSPGTYFANISSIYDATHPFTIAVANNSASATEFFGIYADGGGANNRAVFPNGNVGIGLTNPSAKLHVRGEQVYLYNDLNTNNTFFYVRNSGAGNAGIKMKNLDGEWTIIANDRLRFIDDDAGVERLSILSNGNVGVGLTIPQKPLDVISSSNDFVTVGARGLGVGNWCGIHFGYREDNNLYRKSAIVFERTDLTSNNAQGKVHILNGPQVGASNATLADAKITINEAGNVGIGSVNPTQKLDVAGYAMAGDGLYRTSIYGSNGGAWISFGDTGVLESLGRIGAYSALFNINSINGDTSFQYNSSEKMRITTAGNVGIGVTNPGVRLQVVNTGSVTSTSTVRIVGATGNGGGSQIEFFKGASQKFSIGTASAITGGLSDDLLIATLNPSSIILTAGLSGLAVFKTDGKVGIGTASPTTLLSVGGPGSTSAASGLTFGGDAEANLYRSAEDTIKTDGSLIVAGNVTATNLISGNGTANYVTKWNGTKSVANSQIFDDGTYVGVNTITNTTYRLQVNGSFAATTKSFDIVHPTISGKRLTYASLEGPENGVYYRGQNNNNEISLPHYWSGLVHDDSITVNLTAVGRRKDGKIRNYSVDQIGHNKVYIYTDSNDNIYNYYYTIFAERKDVSKLVTERDME
jgi:hypothetical protein